MCHRCGGAKAQALDRCPDCGFSPSGADRALAWLFSDAWLDEEERAEATDRLLAGERPDPSRALLEQASRALSGQGAATAGGEPMSRRQAGVLLAVNALLTPLVGFALWLGWRGPRPRAARQALWLTAPVALLGGALWLVLVGARFA